MINNANSDQIATLEQFFIDPDKKAYPLSIFL